MINQTKLPHLGGDLPFALALGFLNSLIYPLFKLFHKTPSVSRFILIALSLNLAAYALLQVVPMIGIHVASLEGYAVAALLVSVGSVLTNFWELKHAPKKPESTSLPEDPLKKP